MASLLREADMVEALQKLSGALGTIESQMSAFRTVEEATTNIKDNGIGSDDFNDLMPERGVEHLNLALANLEGVEDSGCWKNLNQLYLNLVTAGFIGDRTDITGKSTLPESTGLPMLAIDAGTHLKKLSIANEVADKTGRSIVVTLVSLGEHLESTGDEFEKIAGVSMKQFARSFFDLQTNVSSASGSLHGGWRPHYEAKQRARQNDTKSTGGGLPPLPETFSAPSVL